MKARIGKRVFVPNSLLDASGIQKAKTTLRFTELLTTRMADILKEYAAKNDEMNVQVQNEYVTVNEYVERKGGVSVPRAWFHRFSQLDPSLAIDCTTFPRHKIEFPAQIKARDAKQAAFFKMLKKAAKLSGPQEILANANTGSGKTVAGIYLGQVLRTPTLILVDSNKIGAGWLKNFRQFYGEKWTERYVGRVQRDHIDFKDKAFTITLVQSQARRNYGHEFYRHFGLVVYDEVQVYGGPHYAPVLGKFPARVRAHFTAENRDGAFGRRIKAHTGDTRVSSSQKVLTPKAWLIRNKLERPFYCQTDGSLINGLASITSRNQKIAGIVYDRGFKRDRQVLVLSDRTQQLKDICDMCAKLGTPYRDMGLHMGGYTTDRFVVYYAYHGSNKRNRICVEDNKATAQSVVRAFSNGRYSDDDLPAPLLKRLKEGENVTFSCEREVYSPSQKELDDITNSCQIIFATYQIFSKGVDVPRLDMGVEATPSGNLKQPLGRIVREFKGKPQPEWYSIHDTIKHDDDDERTYLLTQWFDGKTKSRLSSLEKANVKVKRV